MKGVMIQGTASDAGKSFIATALCRLLKQKGFHPVPFKSQNVSNNSYVTADGKEIGRAQGLQAEACGLEAIPEMNPILLKPSANGQSEIVWLGERKDTVSGLAYRKTYYEQAVKVITESLHYLEKENRFLVIEGAGSPVEMNLKTKELVNMKIAEMADVPVILTADINRGGLFASVIGTLELLEPQERSRVKGIIINKFHGDPHFFEDGKLWLEERTGIPVLAILPYLPDHHLEAEDSLSLAERFHANVRKPIDVAVIQLPYLSNYSDIEPFLYEEDTSIRWVQQAEEFGAPDALIIPGTKSTLHDLAFLKDSGLMNCIQQYAESGGIIAGLCGGFQMLGEYLTDPDGYDSGMAGRIEKGAGLIPAYTVFYSDKTTIRVKGKVPSHVTGNEIPVEGFEIHMGQTLLHSSPPFIVREDGSGEGYASPDGRIIGTYLHHVFHSDSFRSDWLNRIRQEKGLPLHSSQVNRDKQNAFDQIAEHLEKHLNWERFLGIIEEDKKDTVR
ncbi:adenosylcobyric acid synthase [Bacillus ectoiniformans]|uniref:cobyric acid synthase n=1 Tax=Bacillus ectoiniformans TaxID=1494429 RepID=UPI0019584C2A|nr:cobyric acid synthase [Bacillus ectoiniformans]MBM7649551.1 adenosylcobyric acid synthase [Bacillus ectoiniformans]